MDKDGQSSPQPPKNAGAGAFRHLAWAGAVGLVALCVLAGFAMYQCSPAKQAGGVAEAVSKTGAAALRGAEKIIAALNAHTVVESFNEHLVSAKPDKEGRMLVAEVKAQEEFNAADANWLGTTTADIRVPVTYHYFVALGEPWEINVSVTSTAVVCSVTAPPLKPLPDPSIDTAGLQIRGQNGWLRWDVQQVQDNLLKQITLRLNTMARQKTPQYFPIAREAVQTFVKKWILSEYLIPDNVPVYVDVHFKNEPASTVAPPPPKG